MSVEGKVVWLTGASSGIGAALAEELARRKAVCVLTSRSEQTLEELSTKLSESGAKVYVKAGDVTAQDEMILIAQFIEEEIGPLDILIANAGTHLFTVPENFDCDEYLKIMDLNYGGTLRCIQAALPYMQQRERGQIVGIASLAGFRGLPRAAAYGASKSALIHFLESARFHLNRQKIGVTIVNPGFVRTPLTDKNDFHMPFLMDAQPAAKLICNAIEKGKDELSFPIPFSWGLKTMRIIPFPLYKWIVERFVWK